ncbi:MAG TPA: hypothetical protein PL037_04195 [Elusimicrobiales bacterium]|nr:hypothetical protein [Elusimicrobiales bacterium]
MDQGNMAPGGAGSSAGRPCWACGAEVPRGNDYCGKCGQGQGRFVHWYYRHSGAALLSIAAGPFALYFIWRSPVLPRGAKMAYTAAVCALTWYAVSAVLSFWNMLRDAAPDLRF